jgi:hypothetical protein
MQGGIRRFADRAFRALYNGERYVVSFEAYTYWSGGNNWTASGRGG